MERFERLLGSDATDVERALLDSASDDGPSARARRRTLVAMGVGAGVVAGTAQAAHAATQVAVSGTAKSGGSASVLVVLKALGTGALIGSVVAAGIATVTTPGLVFGHHPAPVTTEIVPAVHASTPRSPSGLKAPAKPVSLPREPVAAPRAAFFPSAVGKADRSAPPGEPLPAEVPPATAAVPVQSAPASQVVAEVASLDRARAALSAGNAREALARVMVHDATFPRGTMEPEAVVLRVRALVALGEGAQAKRVADRFIAAHPDSAQAGPLRALVSGR